jgi:hypothetical protein
MEPGPRPSTARQALPERPPVAGPSRSCSAARLALAGARRPARRRRPVGRNRRGQRETAPRTKWAGGSRQGRSRSCSVGTPGGNWHPAHRRPAGRLKRLGRVLEQRSRIVGHHVATEQTLPSGAGLRIVAASPHRDRGYSVQGGREEPVELRLDRFFARTIESPGPTGDACSDAKSAFAKTSTARPWGGTQEPAGHNPAGSSRSNNARVSGPVSAPESSQ